MKKVNRLEATVGCQGFSLVELMIALAIISIVIAVMAGVFSSSNRLYTRENSRAALQAEIRGAMEIMSREIRMAGYDPLKKGVFGLKNATATRLHFNADLNEDGIDDPAPAYPACEIMSFRYSGASRSVQMICGEGTGVQDVETLIGDTALQVTGLNFDYKDSLGNSTTFIPDMRGVVVTLVAEMSAGRDGIISRTYETWVDFRNAAPNAAH